MKILKYLVPLLVIASIAIAVELSTQKNIEFVRLSPASTNDIAKFTGTLGADAAIDDSVFIFLASGGLRDSTTQYGGDSIAGFIMLIANQWKYITMVDDTADCKQADSVCSLWVSPKTAVAIDSGTAYTIFPRYTEIELEKYPNGYVSSSGIFSFGWNIQDTDTMYSEPILWQESKYGDSYSFKYICKADTSRADSIDTSAPSDSTDRRVWYEVSFDGHNWYQPTGATNIYANITDYAFHEKQVLLPKGTGEFRICVTGNVNNSGFAGMQYLLQWIQFPGK